MLILQGLFITTTLLWSSELYRETVKTYTKYQVTVMPARIWPYACITEMRALMRTHTNIHTAKCYHSDHLSLSTQSRIQVSVHSDFLTQIPQYLSMWYNRPTFRTSVITQWSCVTLAGDTRHCSSHCFWVLLVVPLVKRACNHISLGSFSGISGWLNLICPAQSCFHFSLVSLSSPCILLFNSLPCILHFLKCAAFSSSFAFHSFVQLFKNLFFLSFLKKIKCFVSEKYHQFPLVRLSKPHLLCKQTHCVQFI